MRRCEADLLPAPRVMREASLRCDSKALNLGWSNDQNLWMAFGGVA